LSGDGCDGVRGAAKALVMALLIASFLASLAAVSRLIWLYALRPLGVPECSPPPLQALGVLVALLGVAGLVWVYSVFPPVRMLCRTLSDLPETVKAVTRLLLRRRPAARAGCSGGIEVVAEGPYRCVRHPLYSSALLALAGCSIAAPWLLPAPVIAAPVYYILSLAEEAVLDERTCGSYSQAMRCRPLLNPLRLALCIAGHALARLTRGAAGRGEAGVPSGGC